VSGSKHARGVVGRYLVCCHVVTREPSSAAPLLFFSHLTIFNIGSISLLVFITLSYCCNLISKQRVPLHASRCTASCLSLSLVNSPLQCCLIQKHQVPVIQAHLFKNPSSPFAYLTSLLNSTQTTLWIKRTCSSICTATQTTISPSSRPLKCSRYGSWPLARSNNNISSWDHLVAANIIKNALMSVESWHGSCDDGKSW